MATTDADGWYERAWRLHAATVWAYAARRVGAEDADEIVSKVFLVLWRRSATYGPAPARATMIAIARRVVADAHRSAVRRRSLINRLEHELTPMCPSGASEDDDLYMALVKHLSPGDLQVLEFLAWDGLRPREIAEVLAISRGAARKRVFDARRRAQTVIRKAHATNMGASVAPVRGGLADAPSS